MFQASPLSSRLRLALGLALSLAPVALRAGFGLSHDQGHAVVDTGAGLVFRINEANGDLVSLRYHDLELQDQKKFSGVSSGLGSAKVTAALVGSDLVKIACATPTLTHYYIARRGESVVYLATYVTAEPQVGELRYIFRLSTETLPGAPEAASDLRDTTGAIESKDIFGLPDGQTRSKYYAKDRALELDEVAAGATGRGVGAYVVFGNREKSSGGPFFRDIQHQTGGQNEIYNYMNSGHNQTEAHRMGLHGPYALVVTPGPAPAKPLDFEWMDKARLDLAGFVPTSARGRVALHGLNGLDPAHAYVVGFANADAQYWVKVSSPAGACLSPRMIPGAYTLTVYKGELAVHTEKVSVSADATTTLAPIVIADDPSEKHALWRIGDWDGTPNEFLNASRMTSMHPSDPRLAPWSPGPYIVGQSKPAAFPCCQWRDINGEQVVRFHLTSAQAAAARTVRVGVTAAYSGGRPVVSVNDWDAPPPEQSAQPKSRSLTIGTYRGNNATFVFEVPSSALREGENTLSIRVFSGHGSLGRYLSPGYSLDCVDFY